MADALLDDLIDWLRIPSISTGEGDPADLVFGALPDSWTMAGAAIIAASGLYTAYRERVRAGQR